MYEGLELVRAETRFQSVANKHDLKINSNFSYFGPHSVEFVQGALEIFQIGKISRKLSLVVQKSEIQIQTSIKLVDQVSKKFDRDVILYIFLKEKALH